VYCFGSSKVVTITKTVPNPLIGITLSPAYKTLSSIGNLKSINLDLLLQIWQVAPKSKIKELLSIYYKSVFAPMTQKADDLGDLGEITDWVVIPSKLGSASRGSRTID
jgi:hypothetical protein